MLQTGSKIGKRKQQDEQDRKDKDGFIRFLLKIDTFSLWLSCPSYLAHIPHPILFMLKRQLLHIGSFVQRNLLAGASDFYCLGLSEVSQEACGFVTRCLTNSCRFRSSGVIQRGT